MNTVEKKKLIAVFVGYMDNGCSEEGFLICPKTNFDIEINSLQFDKDWNSLMLVVEKIETLPDENFQVEINGKWCNFFDMKNLNNVGFEKAENESKIQNCFEAVVMFIRWYNDKTIEFWEQDYEFLTL